MQLQILPLVLISTLVPFNKLGNLIGEESRFLAPMLMSDRSNNSDRGRGTPDGQRSPGGTRPEGSPIGTCPTTEHTVIAIVPENAKGFTTQNHPVFWFYIPYTEKDIESIEFVLTDPDPRDPKTVYKTSISLENTPAIISVPLPQNHALQSDIPYQWWLTINCAEKRINEDNDIDLNGWIEKISPEDRETSTILWYDEVTKKARQYRDRSNNLQIQNEWNRLLQFFGLEQLMNEKIIEP